MKRKKNIILIFIILCFNFTVNCRSLNSHVFIDTYLLYKKSQIETYLLYKKSQKELKNKRFNNMIVILEHIKNNNVTHFNDDKIRIHLIYGYYKTNNFNMAIKNIKEFLNNYPNHPNTDYAEYIKCLINIQLDKNIFLKNLLKDYYKRDLNHSIYTFLQLKKFINKYPYSLYLPNAKKHLLCLKNHLSEYDLQILKFYFFRQEYISVISRGQEMLQKYPETKSARIALKYMQKSYNSLKMFDISKKISKIIILNDVSS
ncbi:outer membrane protein assembly factor BamD [Buchnera aphidicola]|uniref:Outer membrane protein assembly factor BamD n=1 Tax=Buchnera aphidicola subsp. Uroleucon sonchi TaxID=118118 RepID=A0A6C1FBW6_BUCUN|nr:outer membrane protein assembly factor BamD [Buchnera aphidicola]QIE02100.1 outer membrane protein assembly factor BamD [Buchnera aphidicola (Uroleucon sonchi)]